MKGKKIFPGKNNSNIFFVTSENKPQTQNSKRAISSSRPTEKSLSISGEFKKKPNFKKRNFSIDNSELKFKEKINNKIKLTEPNIAKFRKKKENVSFLFNEKYYQKFVNKTVDNSIKQKNNSQITYELSKTKNDNRLIDTHDVKQSFTRNGINMYKIYNCTSGLTPVNNDKVCFTITENDSKSTQFKQIKKTLQYKGLQITKKDKPSYDRTTTIGIFPAKSNWKNLDLGNREGRRRSSTDQKEMNFNKKSL